MLLKCYKYIWHSKIFVLLAVKLQEDFIFYCTIHRISGGLAFKTHFDFQINYQGFYEYWVCHFYLPFTLPPLAGFVPFSAFFLPPSLPTTAAKPSSFLTFSFSTRYVFYFKMVEIIPWQLYLLFKMTSQETFRHDLAHRIEKLTAVISWDPFLPFYLL